MTSNRDRLHELNGEWRKRHPAQFTEVFTAQDLAFAVVHWHHNIESEVRLARERAAKGEPPAPGIDEASERFFCREYARAATKAWLEEVEARTPRTLSDEMQIRNLQVALDDFHENDLAKQAEPMSDIAHKIDQLRADALFEDVPTHDYPVFHDARPAEPTEPLQPTGEVND